MQIQRNRIYSLIVGSGKDFVEINNLQITFRVQKTSSNKDKKNKCTIDIYNLSRQRQKLLEEDYVQVELKVGYSDTELLTLFSGEVVDVGTKRSGDITSRKEQEDIVTTIELDVFHMELNGKTISKIVPAGKTVADVVKIVGEAMEGVAQMEMNGEGIKRTLPDGYPLSGTPRQMLDEISSSYNVEWQLDGSTLYISDRDGSFQKTKNKVVSIGQFSGLISRPFYTTEEGKRIKRKKGDPKKRAIKNVVEIEILLNPALIAGSIIYLDYPEYTGYYKITELTHEGDFRGDAWSSKLIISAI
jgi:hypothetical protein